MTTRPLPLSVYVELLSDENTGDRQLPANSCKVDIAWRIT